MPQLSQDTAGDLIARTPSYEFRSAGKLCTACGAIIRNVRGDDQIHDQWHQALAVLLATLPFGSRTARSNRDSTPNGAAWRLRTGRDLGLGLGLSG